MSGYACLWVSCVGGWVDDGLCDTPNTFPGWSRRRCYAHHP